jgi:hypothetical protein
MKRWKFVLAAVTFVTGLFAAHPAFSQSVAGCGAGNQDSTCIVRLTGAPQTPPTCPSGPGYPASPAAVWLGSRYSTPACSSYQPPPTCPSGYSQSAAPSWDGSSWVGGSCVADIPTAPDGNAYVTFLAYCGVTLQPSYLGASGGVDKPYPVSSSCTTNFSGASRALGVSGMQYWTTPNSVLNSTNSSGGVSGLSAFDHSYLGMGMNYTTDSWQLLKTTGSTTYYTIPAGYVAVLGLYGVSGATPAEGVAEGFVFACPASYPTLNIATLDAYADTNPSLIECQP